MRLCGRYEFFGCAGIVGLLLAGACAVMAATPFAITASNVTMPSSGNGITNYTVAGIPMTGTLVVGCLYSGPATTAHLPICGGGPVNLVDVTAGQTVTGKLEILPYGVVVPAVAPVAAGRGGPAWPVKTTVAAGILLGLGFLRRKARWSMSALLAIASVAGLLIMGACGVNSSGATPGTYTYTLSATNQNGGTAPLSAQTSTTITVTVP